jgi:leader peptidase (prepilin peptidase) / N-methyltransferase
VSPAQIDTLAMALVMGAVAANLGSFTTVLAHREGTGLGVSGRSQCPRCHNTLTFRDLVPILSWIWLRGHCRHCHTPIAARYLATEVTFAAIAVGVVTRHGASVASLALAMTCIGIAMAARMDLVTQTLPNPILAVTAVTGLVMFSAAAFANADWSQLIRALSAAGIAFVIALVVYAVTKGGLGEGDVKFVPLIWLPLGWLGWGAAFAGYLVTAAVALVFAVTIAWRQGKWRGVRLPLGPALASGVILVVVFDLHWPAELSR